MKKIKKSKKILVFNPFGIGDVLFTTPLIRNLKTELKDISISYLCNRRARPLLENNEFIDEVMIFEKDEWKQALKDSKIIFIKKAFGFFKQIKKAKFDIVFDLSMNTQYGFFLKLSGIKTRIGFNYRNRGKFLTHKINIPQGYKDKHVARYCLDLLQFLNIKGKDYRFDLTILPETVKKVKKILFKYALEDEGKLICVFPGSGDSWQKTAYFKRWPKEYFIELCRRIVAGGAEVLLLGSPAEADLCMEITNNLNQEIYDLCGKVSLEEAVALMSLSELVITNDGGPFHIAQALNKKVIGFYGPVDEKVYGPYPDEVNSIALKSDIDCRPCYWSFRFKGCDFDKKCLRRIKVDSVVLAIEPFI